MAFLLSPCGFSELFYFQAMILLALLAGCGVSEETELRAQVTRLETELAQAQAEIAGLRRAQANIEMLEDASAAQTEAIVGECELKDGRYLLSRELIAEIQESPESLVREGRWIPSSRHDYAAWRAVHIRRGSLLASCGIQNGDVLVAVNGESEPSAWREILNAALELEEASAAIRRGGEQVELNYRVR